VYKVETYAVARLAYHIEGKSARRVAKELGLNRRTVQKMVEVSAPPGYIRKCDPSQPKLDPHKEWIDELLESDKKVHRKQRHTVTRIYHRLVDERGYNGKYTILRCYIAKHQLRSKEMFVPLAHDPGMGQVDFGQADVYIGGKRQLAHFFVMQLPFSDAIFVKAYPAENTESFCDGHISAFAFFGGVVPRIIYDNTTIAVKKILGGGKRDLTTAFTALQSHYLFTSVFANPARGNEKGGVENLVGYARRNFMVPIPDFESFDALNEHLSNSSRKRESTIVRGHKETVGQRLAQESYLPIPSVPYEACRLQAGRVTSQGLVRFQDNDYSVPTQIGCQKVWVKGYHDRVVIIWGNQIIATHARSYDKEQAIFNPLHYLKLLERKAGAFEQAAPLKGWALAPVFNVVRDALVRKDGKAGLRTYIRILQYLENYSENQLQIALEQAIHLSAISEEAILHLLRRNLEQRPHTLTLAAYPNIPVVQVDTSNLRAYSRLLSMQEAV
jgi:transposase